MTTTYDEVIEGFASRSAGAARALAAWRSDLHKRDVIPFVEHAVTASLYRVTPASIKAASETTEHALGDEIRTQLAERADG